MKSHYRKALSLGWQTVKKHRALWVLGFFASFALNTGIAEGAIKNVFTIFQNKDLFSQLSSLYSGRVSGILVNAFRLDNFTERSGFFSAILIAGLLLFIVYLSTISCIGIIQATAREQSEKKLNIKKILSKAHDHFATVLALNIVSRLSLFLVFILTSIPLYLALATQELTATVISLIIFFLLFIPASLVVVFIFLYGTNYAILENHRFFDSLAKGWTLFTGNVFISLEIGLTMILIRIATILLTFAVAGIIFVPLAVILSLFMYTNQVFLFSMMVAVGAILTVSTYIIINSVFAAYYLGTWTSLFINLNQNKIRGKMERVLDYIMSHLPQAKAAIKIGEKKLEIISKKEYKKIEPTLKKAGLAFKEDAQELAKDLKPIVTHSVKNALHSMRKVLPKTAATIEKINSQSKPKIKAKTAKKK